MQSSLGVSSFYLRRKFNADFIAKVSAVLASGGRMLFTAGSEPLSWLDAVTGKTSISLGLGEYRKELDASGMSLIGTHLDQGGNHDCSTQKR